MQELAQLLRKHTPVVEATGARYGLNMLSFQVQVVSERSPFALSLSKGLWAGCAGGFDRLSPNGIYFTLK